ncbi:unnamed protein product [Boreogadus saida]
MAPEREGNRPENYNFATEDVHSEFSTEAERDKLAYCVTDVPPWYLCIILGIQHCLTAFGGIIAIPLILSQGLCLQHDSLTQSHLISTIFLVSGVCTLLQVTFGVSQPQRSTDGQKKRCLERSPSSGSARQAAQEAVATKAAAACSAPRHLKHARCPSPGAREAGQEAH